jgi:hypothetical protein
MPDPARQLQAIYAAGFDLESFERFPRAIGVRKGGCVALLEASPEGLRLIGEPGWRMGEVLGVLITLAGRKVFQAKSELVEATAERLEELRRFREELDELLAAGC